jgi:large subunit ribosomal protein L18
MSYKKNLSPRERAKFRIRKKVFGTPDRPRLVVFRSLKNIYAQLIDDINHRTLVAVSSLDEELNKQLSDSKDVKKPASPKLMQSLAVGKLVAQKAKDGNITKVVFDRRGYLYHGRVKAVADAAREAGLKF